MWVLEKLSSLALSPSYANADSMNNGEHEPPNALIATGQHLQQKVKCYFSLAKREIDKAICAEEYGLPAEALKHYKAAQLVLGEGMSLCMSLPSEKSSRIANTYHEKMLKWQDEVYQRVQVLLHRQDWQLNSANVVVGMVPKSGGIPVQKSSGYVASSSSSAAKPSSSRNNEALVPKGIDSKLADLIENEILDKSPIVTWDSIAGLEKAKQALMEMVILPIRRSDLFTGLRKPARGLLLFGPPGNGKTLLAKAVASESSATFFSISASSLTSKWMGEGEKLMRALFAIARARQPAVIFIDEIDSIMSARGGNDHEASRRLKSEFLIQFDGVMSNENDHVVVMGATNRPEEIDDAVRRRLVKRIYIPLPAMSARMDLLCKLLTGRAYSLPRVDIERIAQDTDGYSGSDLKALCQEAAMFPLREIGTRVHTVRADQVRSLMYMDFQQAMRVIRPSVSKGQLEHFDVWNHQFGAN